MGGTYRLTKLVGPGNAKRLLMTCEEISAQEAYDIGLSSMWSPPTS
jgi:enoyl-CoA hydratase